MVYDQRVSGCFLTTDHTDHTDHTDGEAGCHRQARTELA